MKRWISRFRILTSVFFAGIAQRKCNGLPSRLSRVRIPLPAPTRQEHSRLTMTERGMRNATAVYRAPVVPAPKRQALRRSADRNQAGIFERRIVLQITTAALRPGAAHGSLAQQAEHLTCNERVTRSIRVIGSKKNTGLQKINFTHQTLITHTSHFTPLFIHYYFLFPMKKLRVWKPLLPLLGEQVQRLYPFF